MHVQKLRDGRWAARYKTPDGRYHRTSGHPTQSEALAAARAAQSGEAFAFSEGEGADLYYVGCYLTPDGWKETPDGFDTAADALAEARELERAARAGGQPGA